jgi:hypothetical protein
MLASFSYPTLMKELPVTDATGGHPLLHAAQTAATEVVQKYNAVPRPPQKFTRKDQENERKALLAPEQPYRKPVVNGI